MGAMCGAKTRAGRPCPKAPVTGRTRCRSHGGATPTGLAHPSTTHGLYSKDLPTRLRAGYEEALGDPKLLVLRSDVALINVRLADVLQRVDAGESGALWREAKRLNAEVRKTWAREPDTSLAA